MFCQVKNFFFWSTDLIVFIMVYTVHTCIRSSVNYQTGVRTYFVPIVRGFEPLPWELELPNGQQCSKDQMSMPCMHVFTTGADSTEITIDICMHRFQFKHAAVGLILHVAWLKGSPDISCKRTKLKLEFKDTIIGHIYAAIIHFLYMYY